MAKLTVQRSGLFSTIQDKGRFGLRHVGIPWAGALTPAWQFMANALVGNRQSNSVIECFEGGLQLNTSNTAIRFAVMGSQSLSMTIKSGQDQLQAVAGRSYTAAANSSIVLNSTGDFRHAIIAIQGLTIASQLGSTSTYAKAQLGGLDGHALKPGDELQVSAALNGPEQQCKDPTSQPYLCNEIRVLLGPQDDHFSKAGLSTFLSTSYTLTAEADRMGARLNGDAISHKDKQAADIVSDAIVPGSIQVPGSGQPIVLLNDAHTAGGYPKIATVSSVDLPILGLRRPGSRFSFRAVTVDEAISAIRLQHKALQQAINDIQTIGGNEISSEALLAHNLIDGVIDAKL